jgi:GT2 family glycosyltransferase
MIAGNRRATGRALKLSVLIATYGRPGGLENAVESVLQQSRAPDEIVIAMWADDHGTRAVSDALIAMVDRALPSSRVRVVTTYENTVIAKENEAIRAATGDILCFLDDDAQARPQWLERIARHYEDPTVGAVGGRDVIWHADREEEQAAKDVGRLRWFGRLSGNHHRFTTGVRDVEFLKGCDMSFRQEVLRPIDPRLVGVIPYGFEIDLGLTTRAQGRRIVYDPEASVDHYSSTDMSAARTGLAYVTNHNQTYILLKHLPWWRRIAFLLYTFLVGDRNTIGLLRVPVLALRERWSRDAFTEHFQGKLDGIRTFWAWWCAR